MREGRAVLARVTADVCPNSMLPVDLGKAGKDPGLEKADRQQQELQSRTGQDVALSPDSEQKRIAMPFGLIDFNWNPPPSMAKHV